MYHFVLLTFVASVSAYVVLDSQCPELKNVDNFDFESYSNGVWYEIARYPDGVVKDGKCGILKYKTNGDIKKIVYTFVDDNKLKTIEGTAKLAPDAGSTGKLIHSLPYGANGTVVDCNLNILAVDYEEFFFAYYCQFDGVNQSYREAAWILSRSKTLSENTKTKIDDIIKESTFLNAHRFIWPSNSAEDCRLNA